MAATLTWISLAVGILCTGGAVAMSIVAAKEEAPPLDPPVRRALIITAVATAVVTVILFLGTLPMLPPFASGQRLGYGFLIGGLLSAAAGPFLTWLSRRGWNRGASWPAYSAGIASGSLALFGVSLTFLIFRGYPQPALMGFSMAAVMAAVMFRLGIGPMLRLSEDADAGPVTLDGFFGIEVYAVTSVALAAATSLAAAHFSQLFQREWWPSGLLVFATICLVTFAAVSLATIGGLTSRPGKSYALAVVVTTVLTLVITTVYVMKLYPQWPFFFVTALGIAAALLAIWLIAGVSRSSEVQAGGGLEAAAVIVLLIIATTVTGFRLMAAYGSGIAVLAGWALALPAFGLWGAGKSGEADRKPILPAGLHLFLSTGLAVVLYRVFTSTYAAELRQLDLRAYYTFTGILLGAVAPFVAGSILMRLRPAVKGVVSRLTAVGLVGLVSAAAPVVVMLVWGLRAELGFVVGLVAAETLMLLLFFFAASGIPGWGRDPITSLRVNLLTLGMLLSAIQLSRPFITLLDMPRVQKAYVLSGALALGILLAAGSWIAGKFERRSQ